MDSMIAFIWDMDGTLVDSYPAIVPAAQEALAAFGFTFSRDYIYSRVILTSVKAFIEQISADRGISPDPVYALFSRLNDSRIQSIAPMPHAQAALSSLISSGHQCFVYTHRGASCCDILSQTGLLPYFTEVITALDGFPRKPAPDAILYLIEKYHLRSDSSFYIGDRSLDIDAAVNAGIGSILYLNSSSPGTSCGKETYIIKDLMELESLFAKE